MKESTEVKDAMARYWAGLGAADPAVGDTLITSTDPAIVVGTGPGEGRDGSDAWRQGYRDTIEQLAGLVIEPGPAPRAFEESGVGWLTDEPTWVMADGTRVPTRVTTVWHQEDGDWRVVHLHLSIGVPDELLGDVIAGGA